MTMAMDLPVAPAQHLSAEEVAAFLEGRLQGITRTRVESHLSTCSACRDEVGATSQLLGQAAPGQGWTRAVLGLAATAALAIGVRAWFAPSGPEDVERAVAQGELSQFPQNGALVPPNALRLSWSQATPRTTYRVTVTDSLGSNVWVVEVQDTTVTTPDSVRLAPGSPYYWFVDALLADGRRRSTGVHQFRVR